MLRDALYPEHVKFCIEPDKLDLRFYSIEETSMICQKQNLILALIEFCLLHEEGYVVNFEFYILNNTPYIDVRCLNKPFMPLIKYPLSYIRGKKGGIYEFNGHDYFGEKAFALLINLKKTEDPKEKKPPKTYLMFDKTSGYYKIGRAVNPKFREKTLAAEVPCIKIVHVIDRDIESKLHTLFKNKRHRGEWFKLSKSDVKHIKTLG